VSAASVATLKRSQLPVRRSSHSASGQPHVQLLIKGIASLSIIVSLLGVGIHSPKIVAASTPYTTAVLNDSPSVFYETSETSGVDGATDSSGNSITGTYGSALDMTYSETGPITSDSSLKGIADDGSVNAITASDSSLPMGGDSRSVEIWFNTTANADQQLAFYGDNSGGSNSSFSLSIGESNSDLVWGEGSYYVSAQAPEAMNDGNWHQAVVTYDSGADQILLYLDGQLIGGGTPPESVDTTAAGLIVGGDFNGELSQFSVYPSVLSASDVNTHFRDALGANCVTTPTSGYLGLTHADGAVRSFSLGSSDNGLLDDYSGNCRDASYQDGAQQESGSITDNPSASGPVMLGSADGLPTGNDSRSVELWFNTTTNGTMNLLDYGTGGGSNNTFNLGVDNENAIGWAEGSYGNEFYTTTNGGVSYENIADGYWHQLAVTYDSGTDDLKMYLDGLQIDSTQSPPETLDTLLTYGSDPGVLGSGLQMSANSYPWQGSVGLVSIYPSALSSSDISAMYAAVAGPTSYSADTTALNQFRGIGDDAIAAVDQHTCNCADPVNNASGNFYESATDVNVPGRGFNLNLTRSYNSLAAATDGPFGYGWTSNLGMSLAENSADTQVTITDESGAPVTFTWNGSDWVAPDFYASTLVQNGDGTWTYARWDGETFTFNSSGQLTAEQDRNGNDTTFTYSSGNLATMTDASGRTLSFTWTGSHITQVEDPDSQTVSYSYDGSGNLASVTNLDGKTTNYTYDSAHDLLTMEDPNTNTVTNTYNTSGQVTDQEDARGHHTTWSYGVPAPDETSTLVTDPNGDETYFVFGAGDLLLSETAAYGTASAATTTYTYDPTTLAMASMTDANGNTATYTYDDNGNLLTKTDPLGHEWQYTYNSLNEVLTAEDPLDVTTTNTYDSNGNLLTTSTPLTGTAYTQETQYTYGDSSNPGLPTAIEDPNDHTTDYAYDSYGDLTSVTDPAGNKTSYTYDILGRKLTEMSPKGNVSGCGCSSEYATTWTYNPYNEVLTVTDPDSNETTNTYDNDGNLEATTDPAGNKTVDTYNGNNQVTEVQKKNSSGTVVQTTYTSYDDDGNVTSQTDGNGNETTYNYNALNQQTSMENALSKTTDYTYDGVGNLLTTTEPTGVEITNTYNDGNELTETSYSDSTHDATFSYDDDGRRTGMVDGTGTSSWTYDSLGRLTSYENGASAEVQYGYDLDNNATSITYPGGHEVTQGFNNLDQMTSLTDWNSNESTFGYDVNGNLTTEDLANGVGDAYTYDHADNLTGIDDTKSGTTVFAATYTLNSDEQHSTDSSQPSEYGNYQYSALNQLCYDGSSSSSACSSPPSGARAYSYDSAGNLVDDNGVTQKFNAGDELCWTYSGSSSNACGSAPSGATSYTYNNNGGLTAITPSSGSATALTYNGANELTQYQLGSSTATTYSYDGDGLRQSKTTGSTTTDFLWSGAGSDQPLLQEKTGSNTTSYIYGPTSAPLEEILPGGSTYYYANDSLGSTRALTDSSGDVADTDTYDPYGNLTASTGSVANNLLYAGQYLDSESGLYYMRARYYDPLTAQFLTMDPQVRTTGQPYAYGSDDPTMEGDPSGQYPQYFLTGGGTPLPPPANVEHALMRITQGIAATGDPGVWGSVWSDPSGYYIQANGSEVYIQQTSSGSYNVLVVSNNGIVTAKTNMSESGMNRMAVSNGWQDPNTGTYDGSNPNNADGLGPEWSSSSASNSDEGGGGGGVMSEEPNAFGDEESGLGEIDDEGSGNGGGGKNYIDMAGGSFLNQPGANQAGC
jgi:RHS repeat-associated protein